MSSSSVPIFDAAGLESGRVAQIRITQSAGSSRGSAYRLNDTTVLTAAHVVENATSIEVVFNPDLANEWSVMGEVAFCAQEGDVALLRIAPPVQYRIVERVRFGKVSLTPAALPCRAVGFPRFKLRDSVLDQGRQPYRDSHQIEGTILALSNWREGTFEITVAAPPADIEPRHSPWEGMSGAAVWCGSRIIGVISRHHLADGLGRLTAVRIDRWYEQLDTRKLEKLRGIAQLPTAANLLDNVVPPDPVQLIRAARQEHIRSISPAILVDRQEELQELAQFCAGEEFYAWWQADPWAGKTALFSWFALHPPNDVSVVSFFVTRRLVGQSDSEGFSQSLIEQLAALTGWQEPGGTTPAARDGLRRLLLERAASQARADQRRVVLIVDGLDEDDGVPPAGRSSISRLLPDRPIEGLRVLVTSRPHPLLPYDIPLHHPLRDFQAETARPRRQPRNLSPSHLGEQLRILAKSELVQLLQTADRPIFDIVGLITVAGGGLTIRELSELTSIASLELRSLLRTTFARSLRTRPDGYSPPESAEDIYLLAHDTLDEVAHEEIGSDMAMQYRARILEWAGLYENKSWEDAPRFFFRPYSRLLVLFGDLPRLVRLVANPLRHDLMRAKTLGDEVALAEIAEMQNLLLAEPEPGIAALGSIAVERFRLAAQNNSLPADLPAVWVPLGKLHRAQSLAGSIPDARTRVRALVRAAAAFHAAGYDALTSDALTSAQGAVSLVVEPVHRYLALVDVATAWAQSGDAEHGAQLLRQIPETNYQAQGLARLASVVAVQKDWQKARAMAQESRALALGEDDPAKRVAALVEVVNSFIQIGDSAQAKSTAVEVERLASAWDDPDRARVLMTLAVVLAAHFFEFAEALIATIGPRDFQQRAMADVAISMASASQADAAVKMVLLIDDQQTEVCTLSDIAVELMNGNNSSLASSLAQAAGDILATDVLEEDRRSSTPPVAEALAATGDVARAASIIESIDDPDSRDWAMLRVVRQLAKRRDIGSARNLSQVIVNPTVKASALTAIAWAMVDGADFDGAASLAVIAEQLSRIIVVDSSYIGLSPILSAVGDGLAMAGDMVGAARFAQLLPDHDQQVQVLRSLEIERFGRPLSYGGIRDLRTEQRRVARASIEAIRVKSSGPSDQLFRAIQQGNELADASSRIYLAVALAESLTLTGRVQEANEAVAYCEQQLGAVSLKFNQTIEFVEFVGSLALIGEVNRAIALMQSMNEAHQVFAMVEISRNLAKIGRTARSLEILRGAEGRAADSHDLRQPEMLAEIAECWVVSGEYSRAKQLAQTIESKVYQISPVVRVASALAAAGRIDDAIELVTLVQYEHNQDAVLMAIAQALALNGEIAGVERIIEGVSSEREKMRARASVAECLTGNASPDARAHARRIVAELLVTDSWHLAIPALAILDQDAVFDIGVAILKFLVV